MSTTKKSRQTSRNTTKPYSYPAELPLPPSSVFIKALYESLKLQSHYAKLLNQYDGGLRHTFDTPEKWIARLYETGMLPKPKPYEVPDDA